jgi:hypothetical protein
MKILKFLLAWFLLYFRSSHASYGDYEPTYQKCFRSCQRKCQNDPIHNIDTLFQPLPSLRLVSWDCEELCHYNCMTGITLKRLKSGEYVYKYYGHWPFERWFGFEEPASTIFSVLNLIPHVIYLVSSLKSQNSDASSYTGYMSPYLKLYALVASNAWIASTVFHMKKTETAIFYDYVSALLVLCCGLLLILRRICGLTTSNILFFLLFSNISCFFVYRVYLMMFRPHFVSFDNHLKVCISVAVITTAVWIIWIFWENCTQRTMKIKKSKKLAFLVQLWFVAASMLEIFDFPPFYRTFDAHSLWHAATVPLGFLFYYFWKVDYEENQVILEEERVRGDDIATMKKEHTE